MDLNLSRYGHCVKCGKRMEEPKFEIDLLVHGPDCLCRFQKSFFVCEDCYIELHDFLGVDINTGLSNQNCE